MSSTITPRRRTRNDLEDTGSDEDDASSQGSKRRRTYREGDELPERSLLPEMYRRSPRGVRRASEDCSEDDDEQQHLPGSIVRVALTNFVTYTKAEFQPGPNLNMIIGPNGTGKSTLVCAICIGLGWSTNNLGRAKDVTEFVKHGTKTAEIEIELKADPSRHSRNPVITHRINKDGGSGKSLSKSTYFIDGRKTTAKAANDLARSFFIQVDNLCQFLPQDRVVEFAALNSVDLLTETQRAAAPDEMRQWHEQLKSMHKDQSEMQKEQQTVLELLKNMEERQKSQEGEVGRLRERDAKKEAKRILQKIRPFADYEMCKRNLKEARAHYQAVADEVKALENLMQPNMDAIDAKEHYLARLDNLVGLRKRMVQKSEADADTKLKRHEGTSALIEDAEKQIQAEKASGKTDKAKLNETQTNIRKIEQALQSPPPAFDAQAMNDQIQDKRQKYRTVEEEVRAIKQNMEHLQEQARQRQQLIDEASNKKTFLQSQAGKQTSKLEAVSRDVSRAWRWVQANRDRFKGDVYGPPMIECSLKDLKLADQVETGINNSEMLAFTVTTEEDYRMLNHQLRRVMNLGETFVRTSEKLLGHFSSPCSGEQLKELGFEGWLLDLLDGPAPVLAMLCDNANLHATAYTSGELSDRLFHQMQQSRVQTAVSASKTYQIFRRREYGEAAFTTKVTENKSARFLTNTENNTQEQQDLDSSITHAKGELELIQGEIRDCNQQYKAKRADADLISKERAHLEQEKNGKQSQKTIYDGLQPKLDAARQKLNDIQTSMRGRGERIMGIFDHQDDLCLRKGQEALDYARALDSVRKLHEQVLEADIMRIEAKSDVEELEARNAHEQQRLAEKRDESAQARNAKDAAKRRGLELESHCRALGNDLTEEEEEMSQRVFDEAWDPERIENEIAQLQASLEMLVGGNEGMIAEFEKRAQRIEDKRALSHRLEEDLERTAAEIEKVRENWEPQLDHLISKISTAFADNFVRIQCAGEVSVHKDDDFSQWAIHIKVKFRENEQLSVLDSHRQSGGERAVSTIFYLMALQSLARAPFRVVDEINQGMDPRNERLVHSRMVEIACAEHTSQYFLITPKLLNNLTYHPNMKVHCIASGEYMPENHRELDFGTLAQKALASRAVSA